MTSSSLLLATHTGSGFYISSQCICSTPLQLPNFCTTLVLYRHSDDMIERLESAGLGFFICITETKQKLGKYSHSHCVYELIPTDHQYCPITINLILLGETPLRHLVYRVLDLPSSMRTLVYDYGSLGTGAESVYIRRIVENHVNV